MSGLLKNICSHSTVETSCRSQFLGIFAWSHSKPVQCTNILVALTMFDVYYGNIHLSIIVDSVKLSGVPQKLLVVRVFSSRRRARIFLTRMETSTVRIFFYISMTTKGFRRKRWHSFSAGPAVFIDALIMMFKTMCGFEFVPFSVVNRGALIQVDGVKNPLL